MSISNSIRISLKIKDQNLHFSEDYVKEEIVNGVLTLVYRGRLVPPTPKSCKKCGSANFDNDLIKHGFKECTIKLPKVSNMDTILKLKKQRFYCKHCQQTHVATTCLIKERCSISTGLYIAILLELKEKNSVKDIARRFNVSTSTVNLWLTKINRSFKVDFNTLPENLSFDEFRSVKGVKGKMSFIFMDSETGNIINIVPNRTLTYLKSYFFRYPLEVRKKVKTICIDMYEPYIQLIRSCFPNARIITDRFHIVQHINRALNSTRIKVMHEDKKNYKNLKRYWKLILKNNSDLDNTCFKKYIGFPHYMTEYLIVNELLRTDKEFSNTYWLAQNLKQSIKAKNSAVFNQLINTENDGVSLQLRNVLKTFRKQAPYITNALEYIYSNGKLEGTNNLIKVIKRIAFGYRNFYNFRARILLISNTMVKLEYKNHSL